MARKLTLGGKAPQSGNKVSHSQRKTKRKWMPNIQTKMLFSTVLNRSIRVTITTRTLRSVDKAGGIDRYLKLIEPEKLNATMRRLQKEIIAREQQDTAAAA
ncbi:MAG: 50S ribosomal protein L28 [Magnetococcales bacterium]|nr:50S ribosomal protein L28 [Magnetococcales bacterium]